MCVSERREIDVARHEILGSERKRLITILAEKKQQIEKLEESALQIKKEEQADREKRAESLAPARR
jgi:hypothetical protein